MTDADDGVLIASGGAGAFADGDGAGGVLEDEFDGGFKQPEGTARDPDDVAGLEQDVGFLAC